MPDPRDSLARGIGRVIRFSGKGGGTTLPGRALLAVDDDAMSRLGSELRDGSVLVSATNGKTTTSAMLAAILEDSGIELTANRAGSNMPWGITTALLEGRGTLGLFEVDEAWLPEVANRLDPAVVILGNLFRDQLDRYGETEEIASRWGELVSTSGTSTSWVLNADDPLISIAGESSPGPAVYFGIEDIGVSLAEEPHARDAKSCRRCGAELDFSAFFLGHLGHWACPSCGWSRPTPGLAASEVTLDGTRGLSATVTFEGESRDLRLPLPGLYNLYNALAAIAGATALGIALGDSIASLARFSASFGRVERVPLNGVEVMIFLIKNPVGANEVIRTLALEDGRLDIWLALNDGIADGRDVSWIWDADFEGLGESIRSVTCAGNRASELALRLEYAGWPITTGDIEPDIETSLDSAVSRSDGRLFALPTYTALLEMRDLVSRKTGIDRYWES